MFKTEGGGGVKGVLKNVKKNLPNVQKKGGGQRRFEQCSKNFNIKNCGIP